MSSLDGPPDQYHSVLTGLSLEQASILFDDATAWAQEAWLSRGGYELPRGAVADVFTGGGPISEFFWDNVIKETTPCFVRR
jgi:hypothetical protein